MSSALDSAPRRPGEFRTGWKPLLGAMAVYAASPVIIAQTASLFIEPVMSQTGLSQTAISIGPIIFITLAVTQPVGIVGAVGGIVPLLLTPILGVVLENSGWRTGYYMIGAFMLIICLPLVVAFFREPKVPVAAPSGAAPTATADSDKPQAQALEGIPARQAAKDPRYWLFTIAFLGVRSLSVVSSPRSCRSSSVRATTRASRPSSRWPCSPA